MKSYYQILGLEKTASQEEIKAAYRRLASKFHPDKYAGNTKFAEDMMKDINVAYQVLSDPEKKIAYDEWLNSESKTNKSSRNSSSARSSKSNKSSRESTSKKAKKIFTKENFIKLLVLLILSFLFHLIFNKKRRR